MTMETQETHGENTPQKSQFKFSGKGGEFFGIWFVNNIFTLLTLGFYSPWAKIRTLQYFYGNTELSGSSFQFTANPWALLRTRIIAVLLLILYVMSENLSSDIAAVVFFSFVVAYFALSPVLLVFMLSFRTRYSVWRGVSFGFNRDFKGAYRVYLAPLLAFFLVGASLALPLYSEEVEQAFGIPHYESAEDSAEGETIQESEMVEPEWEAPIEPETNVELDWNDETEVSPDEAFLKAEEELEKALYFNPYLFIPFIILLPIFLLLLPYFDFINVRFMIRNSRYGNGEFSFRGTAKDYYEVYLKWVFATLLIVAFWIIAFIADNALGSVLFLPLVLITLFYSMASRAYLKSRRTNILLRTVSLQKHHFVEGYIPFWSLMWLLITNNLAIAFSLGLLGPWAKVRMANYMLERIYVRSTASLDGFVDQQKNETSSLAEEVADVFDIDLV